MIFLHVFLLNPGLKSNDLGTKDCLPLREGIIATLCGKVTFAGVYDVFRSEPLQWRPEHGNLRSLAICLFRNTTVMCLFHPAVVVVDFTPLFIHLRQYQCAMAQCIILCVPRVVESDSVHFGDIRLLCMK